MLPSALPVQFMSWHLWPWLLAQQSMVLVLDTLVNDHMCRVSMALQARAWEGLRGRGCAARQEPGTDSLGGSACSCGLCWRAGRRTRTRLVWGPHLHRHRWP